MGESHVPSEPDIFTNFDAAIASMTPEQVASLPRHDPEAPSDTIADLRAQLAKVEEERDALAKWVEAGGALADAMRDIATLRGNLSRSKLRIADLCHYAGHALAAYRATGGGG